MAELSILNVFLDAWRTMPPPEESVAPDFIDPINELLTEIPLVGEV
jgi:hypothetical protein